MPNQTRDSSQNDMINYAPRNNIEILNSNNFYHINPYERDSQQIMNINTDGSEVDVEQSTYQEINTLQAIKQTTFGRPFRHHANEDSLNYSLSPKNTLVTNKDSQFYTFKDKSYNNQSQYLQNDESELLANYQNENINMSNFSANSIPRYQPFSKRYSDRASKIMHSNNGSNMSNSNSSSMKRMKCKKKKLPPKPYITNSFTSKGSISSKSSLHQQQESNYSSLSNSGRDMNTIASPKMEFYAKSKQITIDMQNKVMNMLKEKNRNQSQNKFIKKGEHLGIIILEERNDQNNRYLSTFLNLTYFIFRR